MLSDSDQESAPVQLTFKKKAVKGKGRVRRKDENDEDLNSTSTFGRVEKSATPEPPKQNKWAKYASLATAQTEPEASDLKNVVNVAKIPPEIDDEAVVVDLVDTQPIDNQAYTTMELRTPAKTFSLRESHFRDAPAVGVSLEKEYADAYGNVSDEDLQRATEQVDMESDDDFVQMSPRHTHTLDEMYDSEVSLEEEAGSTKTAKIRKPQELVDVLVQRVAELDLSIRNREERVVQLKSQLEAAQQERAQVLDKL